MDSLHSLLLLHRDHEPREGSAGLQVGEIGAQGTTPIWSSALSFMESVHSLLPTHWTMSWFELVAADVSRLKLLQ